MKRQEKNVDLRIVDVISRTERGERITYLVRPSAKTLTRDPETPAYQTIFRRDEHGAIWFEECTCRAGIEWGKTPKCYHALGLLQREQERQIAEPYAERLHNGVTLDRYLDATDRQNSPLHNSQPLSIESGVPMR